MSFRRDGKRLHRSNPGLSNETFDRSSDWLGWSDPSGLLATAQWQKVGSLQPNTQPFRGHLGHSLVRNFHSVGHLLDRQGEREGDGWGDLCLSCTRHLSTTQIRLKLSGIRTPLLLKRPWKRKK